MFSPALVATDTQLHLQSEWVQRSEKNQRLRCAVGSGVNAVHAAASASASICHHVSVSTRGIHNFLWCFVMGGSELTSQSDGRRVHGSTTVKEIKQYDVTCTFVASVPTIFRQNGNSMKTTRKHSCTLDPVRFA